MENTKLYFILLFILYSINDASSINCYQCSATDSSHPFQCNDPTDDSDLVPEPCGKVYGAQYCIKHTGRFEVLLIKCYQCSAATTIYCSDALVQSGGIKPESCDHVHGAQYCIKSTSLEGGIGTKRYCSSLDLGNYCNYVKQPGDILEYRTCVHTCSSDGCNSSSLILPSLFVIVCSSLLLIFKI